MVREVHERLLVALASFWDLFVSAKDLFVEAMVALRRVNSRKPGQTHT